MLLVHCFDKDYLLLVAGTLCWQFSEQLLLLLPVCYCFLHATRRLRTGLGYLLYSLELSVMLHLSATANDLYNPADAY